MTSETYHSAYSTGFGGGLGSASNNGTGKAAMVQRRIRTPHPHDVLSGRGGGINAHPGNVVFREWVRVRKEDYNLAPNKAEKTRVALEVIDQVRNQDPPGRFLTRDGTASSMGAGGGSWWVEVDEDRALAKTSQALREGAPQIRSAHKDEIQQRKIQYAKEHPKQPKHHQHQQQQTSGKQKRRRRPSSTTIANTPSGRSSSSSRSTRGHKRKVSEAFAPPDGPTTSPDNNGGTAQPIVYGGRGGGGSPLTKRLAQGGGNGGSMNNNSNILWNNISKSSNATVAPAPSVGAAGTPGAGGPQPQPRRVIPATNFRAIEKLQENARAAAAQHQRHQQEQQRQQHGRYGDGGLVDGGADTPPLVPHHPSPSIGAPTTTHPGRMEQLSIGEPRDNEGEIPGFPKRNNNLKRVHSLALSDFSFGNITENEMGDSPTIDEEFVNPFADESDISSKIAPASAIRTSNNGSTDDKLSMLRNISSSNGDEYNFPGGIPSTPSTAMEDNSDQQR